MCAIAFVLSTTLFLSQTAPVDVEEKIPTPEEVEAKSNNPSTPLPPAPAKEGEAVSDAERGRIEAMLTRFAGMKLKGQSFEQTFRTHIAAPVEGENPPADPELNSAPASEGPHEFGFRATLPADEKVFVTKLLSAETLGPKRYRLSLELTVPFESIGGYYRFDGGGFLPVPVGWRIDQLKATAIVHATIDFAWKQLPSGNIGIYPGGFLDSDLTEEERKQAKLLDDLNIDVTNLDLSRINLEGINGRRVFIRNGQGVGRGGLLRMALASGQREQIEQMIAGGLNNFIRSNQEKLLGGLNNAFQTTLPETQLQITSFVEKLAVQANLSGKKAAAPAKKPSLFDAIPKKPTPPPKPNPPESLPGKLSTPEK